MDNIYRESTLDEMVTELFTSEPKPVFSIQLQTEDLELKNIFEMLLEIFTKGMKILFAKDNGIVDLESLSAEEFMTVKQRFRSLGIDIYYEVKPYYIPGDITDVFDNDIDEDNLPDFEQVTDESIRNRSLDELPVAENDKLSDYFYTIHCKNADYKIWFDFVKLENLQ
jgi:hypothetical protein